MKFINRNEINDFKDKEATNLKLTLVGDTETGKTCFLYRINKKYSEFIDSATSIGSTNGGSYTNLNLSFNGKIFTIDTWDTSGQRRYESLIKWFYKDADIILAFYNILSKASFIRMKDLIEKIKEKQMGEPIIGIIGTRYDVDSKTTDDQNLVKEEEVLEYSDQNNFYYAHLCCFEKYETGINQIMESVLKIYLENICINGMSFKYSEDGIPVGLCKAKRLIYVASAGGFIPKDNYAFNYVESLAKDFFGIKDTLFIKAEGLDINGSNAELIIDDVIKNIKKII